MSLDVYLVKSEVYHGNITHNLASMARAAGVFDAVWRPDEVGYTRARQLINPLREGIDRLERDPDKFRGFNAPNGWGTYDDLLLFLSRYHKACILYPDAEIEVDR